MNFINQLVKHKGNSDEPCLEIVGDLNKLHEMANIWDRNADTLHIVGINEFIEWTSKNEFTSGEMTAFQAGLAAFPDFIEKCYLEVKKREIEK